IALVSSLITFIAQRRVGAVVSLNSDPFTSRLANALLSYCRYLGKMFWLQSLFVPYVPQLDQNALLPWLAGGVLVIVTILAAVLARRCPYFMVGWLWYLGTLAPVIGLVQVGSQTMADR